MVKKGIRALVFVGIVFAAVAYWAISLTAKVNQSGETTKRTLQEKNDMAIAFIERQMRGHPIPGLMLSVVYKNETALAKGFGTKKYGDANAPVTASTLFQIGSFSKTFIALGIAKLIDDGKMAWQDPVKKHLPWFQLQDKYAEQYTTIADLLSMNSVFGPFEGDFVFSLGVNPTEKAYVEKLAFLNTSRPLRGGYAYSNANFEVLGQVIEAVSKQTWSAFIKSSILDPLGMKETFSQPIEATNPSEISAGHLSCGKTVLGPYDLKSSMFGPITPTFQQLSAGSILSSANDLATFSRFLLNKGQGVFKSPKLIQDMTTGQTVLENMVVLPMEDADLFGFAFNPDGQVVAAGYGIDVVGNIMYGYDFFTKNGDTAVFKQRNGFVPSEELAVVLAANVQAQAAEGSATQFLLDRVRTYILGIYLDIPAETLDATWNKAVDHSNTKYPESDYCDPHYFQGIPWETPGLVIPSSTKTKLVGTYLATESPDFYGKLIVKQEGDALNLQFGVYNKPLIATESATQFIWGADIASDTIVLEVLGLETSSPLLSFVGVMNFTRIGP